MAMKRRSIVSISVRSEYRFIPSKIWTQAHRLNRLQTSHRVRL